MVSFLSCGATWFQFRTLLKQQWMRSNEISSTDWLAPSTEQNKKKFCISFSISSKSKTAMAVRGTSFTTSLHLSQYLAHQNLPRRRQSVSLLGYNLYSSPTIWLDYHKSIENKFHLFIGNYKLSWQFKMLTRFLFNWIFIFICHQPRPESQIKLVHHVRDLFHLEITRRISMIKVNY